jgi:hypothetical protein
VTHLSSTSVPGNTLSDGHFGIWTKNVLPTAKSANTLSSTVTVDLFQGWQLALRLRITGRGGA